MSPCTCSLAEEGGEGSSDGDVSSSPGEELESEEDRTKELSR